MIQPDAPLAGQSLYPVEHLGKTGSLSLDARAGGCEPKTSRLSALLASTRSRFVCILVAVLLLFAAGLKAYELLTEGRALPLGSQSFAFGLLMLETLLAIWLISGIHREAAWLSTLVTFVIFTAASFGMALVGRTSCACFGRLSVKPWQTCMLDIVVLFALLRWRPADCLSQGSLSSFILRKLKAWGPALLLWLPVIGILGYALSTTTFGSPAAVWNYFSLQGNPPLLQFGRSRFGIRVMR